MEETACKGWGTGCAGCASWVGAKADVDADSVHCFLLGAKKLDSWDCRFFTDIDGSGSSIVIHAACTIISKASNVLVVFIHEFDGGPCHSDALLDLN